MDFVELSKQPLDVAAINDLVVHESCGAVSMFIGTTRDNFEGKKVVSLEYEAYEPMAIKSMKSICNEIRSKWPDIKNIAIYHRIGHVPVKEASVIIAISSPHRESSLLAVSHGIDELKRTVPIWKKEIYDDNNAEWKENKELNASNCRHSKRPKLDFDSCRIDSAHIPKNLIQINADEKELSRRIQCFVEKKREEINLNNTLDFIEKRVEVKDDENSCARIYSTVVKQKDSKGHLRIHRVKNEYGPQTKPVYAKTLDKLTKNESIVVKIKEEVSDNPIAKASVPIVEQRIENVENFLKMASSSKSIHERLKAIEDRILNLESISPEYHHFLGRKKASVPPKPNKQVYSVEDLDKILCNLNEHVTTR